MTENEKNEKINKLIRDTILPWYLLFLGVVLFLVMLFVEKTTSMLDTDVYSGFIFFALVCAFIIYFIVILYFKKIKIRLNVYAHN